MKSREFVAHLVATWSAFFVSAIWWWYAYRAFVLPTFWRYDREGKTWPQFAMWTMDAAIDWPANHHTWFWAAALITGLAIFSRRSSKHQRWLTAAGRGLVYAYIAILAVISISVAIVSTL